MKPLVLQGCGTALVTPFTPDGAVDYEAYASLVDRQVAAGGHFLVPLFDGRARSALADAIMTAVQAHGAEVEQADDCTQMIVRFNGAASGS